MPGRIGETCILWIDLVQRVAEQYPGKLAAEGQQVTTTAYRVLQALGGQQAHGGQQIAAAYAHYRALGIHETGRCRQ